MKVPLSWLQDLVELNDDVNELAESLSMAGFELEDIEDLSTQAKGVVVGYVKEKKPHPNANKLSICNIDIGNDSSLQIVCGAPNVRAGIHVPVACVGAVLSSCDLTIKPTKLRGISSEGMICSLSELGIEDKSDGIAVLDEITCETFQLGEPIDNLLGLDDIVMELAITANRPDGMSMVGISQEVSAISGGKLKLPEIKVHDKKDCFVLDTSETYEQPEQEIFCISHLNQIKCKTNLPKLMKDRLKLSGIKSINPIVDITNYVMLEQGQPLHAYDADKLEKLLGRQAIYKDFGVRYGKNGEKLNLINGKTIDLNPDIQIVTCSNIPIALAGVIGGMETSVSSTTKNIWLESAIFLPSSVRKTSRAVGIRTDSSSRFEKGLYLQGTLNSSKRASDLIVELLNGNEHSTWVAGKIDLEVSNITLRKNYIDQVLGPLFKDSNKANILEELKVKSSNPTINTIEEYLEDKLIEKKLTSIGCDIELIDIGWIVTPPPWRCKDLTREIDLVEEIARLIGYDKFQSNLPDPISPGGLTNKQLAERELSKLLVASGLQEVTTSSLVGPSDDGLRIGVTNPLLAETSHLRNEIWQEHLNICQRNLKAGRDSCWLFEMGKIYLGNKEEISECSQLAGVICGNKNLNKWMKDDNYNSNSYFYARGLLKRVFLSMKLDIKDSRLTNDLLFHPGKAANLHLEGKVIGSFGEIHPLISDKFDVPRNTYIFNLDLTSLLMASTRTSNWIPTYKEYSTYPSMERDIAILVDKEILSADISSLIKKTDNKLLENVILIDRYVGTNIPDSKCSLTFRITYRSMEGTLTEDKIQTIHSKIINEITSKFKAEIRC